MSIGFERLTNEELYILSLFDEYNELVLPDLIPNGNKILRGLITQGIVLNDNPYKLSKRGVRIVTQLRKSHQM